MGEGVLIQQRNQYKQDKRDIWTTQENKLFKHISEVFIYDDVININHFSIQ